MWLEVREEDEEMAASRGLGKVLSKDGKGAGPTTNKGVGDGLSLGEEDRAPEAGTHTSLPRTT